jgi:hypothetical protein
MWAVLQPVAARKTMKRALGFFMVIREFMDGA